MWSKLRGTALALKMARGAFKGGMDKAPLPMKKG